MGTWEGVPDDRYHLLRFSSPLFKCDVAYTLCKAMHNGVSDPFHFLLGVCVMYLLFRCPCSSIFPLFCMGVYNNKLVLLLWAGILGVGYGLHCGNK